MATRGPEPKVTDDALIGAIKSAEAPFTTAPELSEQLPVTSARIKQILYDLEDEGVVNRKRVGSGVAWWIPRDY